MTPEKADELLRAVQIVRDATPVVALELAAAFPAAAPFEAAAEEVLSKIFEVAAVYLTKQGDEARDELRARVAQEWGGQLGGAKVVVE